ncbi:MAG: hypothetical protein HY340_02505 [Candidatus Kerfeldbacteria bacterium]|nr:hypothetical protein [Candidatus Kerfeldbacteria bacterium]
MKIYCYITGGDAAAATPDARFLKDVLERSGVQVITKEQPVEQVFPETHAAIERRGESFLSYVDGIVLEGSTPDPEIGYLLAFAIAQKKPALLLLRKGTPNRTPLATFGQKLPQHITVAYYHEASVEKPIITFLSGLGEFEYQEVPSIKFTLRITPQIEHYLDWKTHNTKMTKADFLRKYLLEDIIPNDEDFQQSRKRRPKRDSGT